LGHDAKPRSQAKAKEVLLARQDVSHSDHGN